MESNVGPRRWQVGDIFLGRCPLKSVDTEAYYFVQAYNLFQQGILIDAGGWGCQSNKYIEAMNIIRAEVARIEKEESNGRKQ
jgi:hypothetical protein